ncbi:MAG TPA: PDDEXK nuclease domain-containing protein [Bacillota bacterium]|nr:PDDEXK nuclease domain-containing protein [Bacillota bacterium]
MDKPIVGENHLEWQSVYDQLTQLIRNSRRKVELAVNSELILLHWNIGKIIKTAVLQGGRGEYGKQTVEILSQQLMAEYGRGFSRRNLFHMINFYETFPEISIVQSLIAQLTWTHLLELMAINDEVKREFYLTMCLNERWSVRVLKDRIASMLYERTAISKKPEETVQTDLVQLRQDKAMSAELFFRDPYILDFLELRDVYTEKDLESAILIELERFILEFGVDFAFLARQKRITVDNEDYYLDLLFYHRKMRRLVLIELKLDKFRPEHKGQVELYLRWLDKHERMPGEESPLAIILCAEKSSETVELLELDKSGIHVAQYLTEMLPKEILERKLREAISRARMVLEQRGVYEVG